MTSATPFQTYRRTRHFGSLDGLRCLSILAVIWHHAQTGTGHASLGYLGVVLFFVISGYLITTLLLRERDERGGISLPQFYARRTLRIFPLYYAVIALYAGLVWVADRHSLAGQQFFSNLPYFLTYTSNWFVGLDSGDRVIFYFAWSLATEEQFYLFWPGVLRWSRARWAPVAFIAALSLIDFALEGAMGRGHLNGDSLGLRILTSVSMPIGLGCLLAFALHSEKAFAVVRRVLGLKWSAPASLALLAFSVASDSVLKSIVGEGASLLIIVLSMVATVGSVCIREDNGLRTALTLRPVAYVGTISYGMYLLHMLALNAARRIPGSQAGWVQFAAATVISVGLASISHRFFETPFLKLKERFRAASPPSERVKSIAAR